MVGTTLVRRLVEDGHRVRASSRSARGAAMLSGLGVEPVAADVLHPGSLDDLFAGADVAYNVAGVNKLCPADRERLWMVNVEGTRNVLRACSRAGVGRLVHTSSAVAIGEERGTVGTEETPHRGHFLSLYERSKVESERLALSHGGDMEVVAVNPSSVQGPGRATGTGRLLLEAARGRARFLVDAVFSLVDIGDCARGHILAADKGVPGERYILSGASMSTRDAVTMIDRVVGREPDARFLRPGPFTLAGRVAGAAYGLVGRDAPLCAEAVRVMLHGHRYDGSRATRDLGLAYTPVEETMSLAIEWFRAEGLLD